MPGMGGFMPSLPRIRARALVTGRLEAPYVRTLLPQASHSEEFMSTSRRNAVALVAGAVVLIVASSATSAVATKLITGADIKDRSITGADIKPGSVPGNRLESGSVKLEHLDSSAIRAGHVYTSRPANTGSRALSPRFGTPLGNGWSQVTSLINVPKGRYLALITGRYEFDPSTVSYKTIECMLEFPSSQYDYLTYYVASQGNTGDEQGTMADSLVFNSTASGTVELQCMTDGSYTGNAWADLVLIPVSTYYQP